jgi:uncharacterized protein DUF6325
MAAEIEHEEFGPLVYLVVEFEQDKVAAEGFVRLLDLVNQRIIHVLDMEFIKKLDDGSVALVEAHDVIVDGEFDMESLDGAFSGLLTPNDLRDVATDVNTGNVAVVVIYEERAILPVIEAWANSGARLLDEGSVGLDDLVEALDATEN